LFAGAFVKLLDVVSNRKNCRVFPRFGWIIFEMAMPRRADSHTTGGRGLIRAKRARTPPPGTRDANSVVDDARTSAVQRPALLPVTMRAPLYFGPFHPVG